MKLSVALIDGDRLEEQFRDAAHAQNISDLMRRMSKKRLLVLEDTAPLTEPIAPRRLAA